MEIDPGSFVVLFLSLYSNISNHLNLTCGMECTQVTLAWKRDKRDNDENQ